MGASRRHRQRRLTREPLPLLHAVGYQSLLILRIPSGLRLDRYDRQPSGRKSRNMGERMAGSHPSWTVRDGENS